MKIIFFDLETTGVNVARHGIHQISAEIMIDGKIVETLDLKVRPNPKAEIDDEALKVGGVTKDQIMAYPPMEEVYRDLIRILGKYVDKFNRRDKFFLCGYNNAAFDNQFLRGFFLQNGDQYFGSWFWSNTIDVMVLASQALLEARPQMENFRLATVAKQFGLEVKEESLHDASYDLFLTRRIWEIVTTGVIQ